MAERAVLRIFPFPSRSVPRDAKWNLPRARCEVQNSATRRRAHLVGAFRATALSARDTGSGRCSADRFGSGVSTQDH